ncbi:MAG: hypothetical protein ACYDBQ_06420 [Thermoplasmatota archaeon]
MMKVSGRGWPAWRTSWGGFVRSATRPVSLVFLALTSAVLVASYLNRSSWAGVLLGGLAAVAAGSLGAFWGQNMTEERAQDRLKMRADAAVGSLKVLRIALMNLRGRLAYHAAADLTGTRGAEVRSALTELEGQVGVLGEQVVNAIENWANVTDQADIRSMVGELSAFEQRLKEATTQLDGARAESAAAAHSNAQQAGQIAALEKSKVKLEDEIRRKSLSSGLLPFAISTPLTIAPSITGASLISQSERLCTRCYKTFKPGVLDLEQVVPLCPDCRLGGRPAVKLA